IILAIVLRPGACANDLADILSALYDVLARNEVIAANDPALFNAWRRKNRPLATSLVNQLLMVAADVDNDIFDSGEQIGDGDGEGIATLAYRVTAFYRGREPLLGVSAEL